MLNFSPARLLFALLFITAIGSSSLLQAESENLIKLVKRYDHLQFGQERPIALAVTRSETYMLTQRGRIYLLPKDRAAKKTSLFLDFSDRKMEAHQFEEGLLGLAFHPNYESNRKLYVTYSQQNPKRTVLSELIASNDFLKADPSTERILLEIEQPFWNHNSGNLLFGKDGYLYYAVGDGGKADDVRRLAQNPWMFNGKILRLDVNKSEKGRGYGIPSDNPFVGKEGIREEIYVTGVRNPWGIYEDQQTGQFIFADVGQNKFEEINILARGGNYGWSYREGFEKFAKRSDAAPANAKYIDPIHVYGRKDGISMTGGIIYRGDRVKALKDYYIYGDWGSGNLWRISITPEGAAKDNQLIWKRPLPADGKKVKNKNKQRGLVGSRPTCFGMDATGALLMLSWAGDIYEVIDP